MYGRRKIVSESKGHRYEIAAAEVLSGAAAVAMALCASLIPFEEGKEYIGGIFYGLFALFMLLFALTAVHHIRFERLPDHLLVKENGDFARDEYNRCRIRLAEITDIRCRYAKDKYSREYSYGTLQIVTNAHTFKIKYAGQLNEAREKLNARIAGGKE